MKIRPLLPVVLLGFPAAFAAGWFLKTPPNPDGTTTSTPNISRAGTQGPHLSSAPPAASLPGAVLPQGIKPLSSLAEILTAMGIGNSSLVDEMVGISMVELAPRLVITDLATVRTILEELQKSPDPKGELRLMIELGLRVRWLVEEPAAAINHSLDSPGLISEKKELTQMAIVFLARTDPQAAATIIARLPENQQADAKHALASMQSLKNPAAALSDPLQRAKLSDSQKEELAARWLDIDPAAAMAWVSALPEGKEREASMKYLIEKKVEDMPDEASMTAALLQFPAAMHDSIRLQWITQQKDLRTAPAQLKNILDRNPSLGSSGTSATAAQAAASAFTKAKDYQTGTQWALSLPPGPAQENATATLVAAWTLTDPAAASGWLTQLPVGPTRDSAASALIYKIQNEDPASALIWAASLSNEQQQKSQSLRVYNSWLDRQPLEATAAIQSLTPEQQQKIFGK
jgi:hypothetical protein